MFSQIENLNLKNCKLIVYFLCSGKENEPKETRPAGEKFFNAGKLNVYNVDKLINFIIGGNVI